MTSNADKLFLLAREGQSLIFENYEIPANPSSQLSQPVFDWLVRCNSMLNSMYGNKSENIREFSKAFTLKMSVDMLFDLANKEAHKESLNKQQTSFADPVCIDPELEKQVLLSMQYTVDSQKVAQAEQLYADLKKQMDSAQPNWDLIIIYLKQSFDIGFVFGSELTILAYSNYKSRPQ